MSRKPAKIFIATTTADGIVMAEHAASLVRMVASLARAGIGTEYQIQDGSSIVAQRNLLAERFMRSDCTHLLFLDSDMTFPADLCETLLGFGKPLIGAVYTKRALDLAKLKELVASRPVDAALPLAYEWNVHPLPGPTRMEGGICRVAALPGGFVLTERGCLEAMAARLNPPLLRLDRHHAPVRAFYREVRDGEVVFDLDYSFCINWGRIGGEVWTYPAADIRHIGDWRSPPPFLSFLAAAGPPRRESDIDPPPGSARP
ncbi:hypothetical protein [Enterovirga aerilata]|uniref:Glycosyltransferase n=1 Tax=Enterovirga aerilata TaxID=2730920 RepID=A0A849IB14_9HYPH|nr:hypothetical protein [Enterovirga sp. DB1703]NNM73177.1 hypothetical protein [Enterovirga sp. DB1703]